MAKVSFSKMALKIDSNIKTINFNDFEIEVKQYLPINEKLELISSVVNSSSEDMKFYNVGKLQVFLTLEMLYAYTNINFTDKQKEDACKLYDIVVSSGLYKAVIDAIPEDEVEYIEDAIFDTIENIYKYQTSALGLMDAITNDYSDLDLNANDIYSKLADPENLALLKGIMTKLG